jgi:hypothetical protein
MKITVPPPWPALTIQTLHTLHLNLSDALKWYEDDKISDEHHRIPDSDPGPSFRSVMIHLNVCVLEVWQNNSLYRHYDNIYAVIKKILVYLSGLIKLQIHLACRHAFSGLYQDSDLATECLETHYTHLADFIQSSSVVSISIDVADVNWALYQTMIKAHTSSDASRFLPESIPGFYADPGDFPKDSNMRRFVCPQEVLILSHRLVDEEYYTWRIT